MATRRPTAAVIPPAVAVVASWWAGDGGPAFGQPARSYRLGSTALRRWDFAPSVPLDERPVVLRGVDAEGGLVDDADDNAMPRL